MILQTSHVKFILDLTYGIVKSLILIQLNPDFVSYRFCMIFRFLPLATSPKRSNVNRNSTCWANAKTRRRRRRDANLRQTLRHLREWRLRRSCDCWTTKKRRNRESRRKSRTFCPESCWTPTYRVSRKLKNWCRQKVRIKLLGHVWLG